MVNPFHPTFGVSPPLLVGREAALEAFAEALEDGPGAAGRATLYTGGRGAGKTVMLNAVEDHARSQGWLVISETATAGVAGRLTSEHLPTLLRAFDPDTVRRRLTGLTAPMGAGAVSWEATDTHPAQPGMRTQIDQLTGLLAEHETGLLITIDEVHRSQLPDLREIAATVQHAFREGRALAFAAAGLAASISDLLNDDVLTFLRRADRHVLGPVPDADAARALREPIEAAGRSLDPGALEVLVAAAGGYPFLLQLVGAQAWRAHSTSPHITVADAHNGVSRARKRLGSLIHEPAVAGISDIGRAYLLAMAQDDGPSRTADIARRLGASDNYASQYRLRLIAADLIHPARRGYVTFALPYLRDYLREHSDDLRPAPE